MLKAAAVEAVSEQGSRSNSVATAKPDTVKAFLSGADRGRAEENKRRLQRGACLVWLTLFAG
jgi:hypothetical protein